MDWAGLKSLLRCGPNNSNQMYPYCNPNIFKLGAIDFKLQNAKFVQKVFFKLRNW